MFSVKRAYHRKALRFHPDKNSTADAPEKFKILSEVYSILMDERAKMKYDTEGIAESSQEDASILPTNVESMRNKYVGSNNEENAIRDAYIKCAGNFERMMARVPFLSFGDKERVHNIIASE